MKLRRLTGDNSLIIPELINISYVYSNLNKHNKTIEVAEEALMLAKSINSIKYVNRSAKIMADTYVILKNDTKSKEYFELYASTNNYLFQEKEKDAQKKVHEAKTAVEQIKSDNTILSSELQNEKNKLSATREELKTTQYESELKDEKLKYQNLVLKEREIELRHRNLLIKFQIFILVFFFIVLFFVYRGFVLKNRANKNLALKNIEIQKQKDELDKKNKNISESLEYAKAIQKAILFPAKCKLQNYIPESFIFYKPRDIVSGDFYWLEDLSLNSSMLYRSSNDHTLHIDENKEIILAAVDCTGHGVPGAIMSMIGNDLLEEIVSCDIDSPNKMLDALHVGVKNTLRQDHNNNSDGMDIALCKIDKKNKKVEFSGAINPLIYFSNGEMHSIEGDIFPIGRDELEARRQPYSLNTINVDQPTMFYIFSDGYQDQIGGENGEKFMSSRFKKLLKDICELPVNEQYDKMASTLDDWMRNGKYKQVDDILVIGFKL